MNVLEKGAKFICEKFTLWIIVFSVLAYVEPEPFKPIVPHISYLLGLIMLGMGLTLSFDDFKLVFSRPKDVLYGVGFRYLIMPFVGFCVAKVLGLPPALAAGVVLLGTCPSGTASNVMSFIAKGDTALSVTVSSVNTILAPVLTPYMFLLLAGTFIPINVTVLFVEIVKIVLLPVATGVVLRMLLRSVVEKVSKVVPAVSVVLIITILTSVVAVNASRLATVGSILLLAVFLHNGIGLLFGYGAAHGVRMGEKKARALTFEIGMENSGLAVALAMVHLDPMAALPAALCSIWQNISGSLLASYWGTKDEPVAEGAPVLAKSEN
ncbi:BASS family bile acid:Na+ symporter [Sporomusaceae bacterium BoRhaA]|uniref:bile acid:sodium symporter family protein n=1 Tax=Pelorhabdus rhamnosifermentans TaxID=2772457 RepID=UPI001C05F840|nr:bile acid:sodium symporter family protein [Pelorhabdus rhamnosifermentans]MBU2700631.1 BASS family bile acid:Na+ symporter [Pelorhabdus rhamnosifermentans]